MNLLALQKSSAQAMRGQLRCRHKGRFTIRMLLGEAQFGRTTQNGR